MPFHVDSSTHRKQGNFMQNMVDVILLRTFQIFGWENYTLFFLSTPVYACCLCNNDSYCIYIIFDTSLSLPSSYICITRYDYYFGYSFPLWNNKLKHNDNASSVNVLITCCRYGDCYQNALEDLHNGCSNLDDEVSFQLMIKIFVIITGSGYVFILIIVSCWYWYWSCSMINHDHENDGSSVYDNHDSENTTSININNLPWSSLILPS